MGRRCGDGRRGEVLMGGGGVVMGEGMDVWGELMVTIMEYVRGGVSDERGGVRDRIKYTSFSLTWPPLTLSFLLLPPGSL